ncbi:hypothetical protein FSP39_011847 [Pinctada imbricata]|uniref:DDE Tnp4 domain-containing protein n=1 Tax=Pinctada imbricata TaxID=66713 RepID=A0AA89CC30_PINIB|nr:hypothetical protein FSP39_011847 [Pinctada imbricata]
MDMLAMMTENANLSTEKDKILAEKQQIVADFDTLYKKSSAYKKDKSSQTYFTRGFSSENVMTDEKQFKYYTGYQPSQFEDVFKFLVPNEEEVPIKYPTNRVSEVTRLVLKDQLFLTIMKLRHNFHHDDLAYRFGVSKQTVSVIFSHWANYMFLRFGEISFWPLRDVIAQHMPTKYAEEFPTTFAMLDCTEIRITKPSSLKAQSQTYSDYKSGNTLKGLVACDPRGSVIFVSMLFSGAMSDKEIFIQSGFQEMLKDLVKEGHLLEGDGLMADKGFNIEEEVRKCGLVLNIPPFSRQGKQMSSSDALLTKKIAKHCVHVERAIERIKRFKILAGRVDLTLFSQINQIWFVCAFLTNFFPPAIKEENN